MDKATTLYIASLDSDLPFDEIWRGDALQYLKPRIRLLMQAFTKGVKSQSFSKWWRDHSVQRERHSRQERKRPETGVRRTLELYFFTVGLEGA